MLMWMTLILGACIGTLLVFVCLFLDFIKKENNKTQKVNNELQSMLDDMTPRDFYIHKMSQTNLVWDRRTHAYVRKWSNNERNN